MVVGPKDTLYEGGFLFFGRELASIILPGVVSTLEKSPLKSLTL